MRVVGSAGAAQRIDAVLIQNAQVRLFCSVSSSRRLSTNAELGAWQPTLSTMASRIASGFVLPLGRNA
jgi:hypothetical protein